MASIFKGRNVELEQFTIGNSVTMQPGDLVKIINGGVDVSNAVTDLIYGICEGITTRDGVPLNQANSADFDGTFTASTGAYAASADNLTDKYVKANVRPVTAQDVISIEADATIGTTTGSNLPGYYISVLTTDSTKADESTAHASNILHLITVDNGGNTNSCQNPTLEGDHILVKVVEAQIPLAVQQ